MVAPVCYKPPIDGCPSVETRSFLRGLVGDMAKAAVVFGVAYGALLGTVLHHYG